MSGYRLAIGYKLLVVVSLALLLGLLPIFLFSKPASGADTLPPGFTQTSFAGGNSNPLAYPTAMDFAPGGKLFVAEQAGTMQVVDTDGTLQDPSFLDISSKVNAVGERGLLGVAFDPDFDPTFATADDNYVYVYYTTVDTSVHNRVSRYAASLDSGNVVAGTEEIIFELPPLSATNHNGGAIHFGTDGKLYVAVGENARPAEAQSLNSLLGKMLRINKEPNSIPTDNPFDAYTTGNNKAIWATGLRNPYSFDVQPNTGRIFINDVGQTTFEEINEGKAGANYGWPVYEGPIRYQAPKKKKKGHHKKKRRHKRPAAPFYNSPLYAYSHTAGNCAITGGAFYNPQTSQFPADYIGDYFFADFCGSWIARYDPATGQVSPFKSGSGGFPVDLKVSEDGELYFLARATGSVEKISYAP
jgi:glucose/arabinose dehydrogenase